MVLQEPCDSALHIDPREKGRHPKQEAAARQQGSRVSTTTPVNGSWHACHDQDNSWSNLEHDDLQQISQQRPCCVFCTADSASGRGIGQPVRPQPAPPASCFAQRLSGWRRLSSLDPSYKQLQPKQGEPSQTNQAEQAQIVSNGLKWALRSCLGSPSLGSHGLYESL